MNWWVWSVGGIILAGENRSARRKTCPAATLPQIPHRLAWNWTRPHVETLVTESWYGKCLQKTSLINVGVPMNLMCSCCRIIYQFLVLMNLSYEISFLLLCTELYVKMLFVKPLSQDWYTVYDKLLSLLGTIHIMGMENYYKFLPLLHFSADCQ
jgi:hypothetical protein